MRFKWMSSLESWFAAPPQASDRARLSISKFTLGVCPRCRGLRRVASEQCSHCGSAKPVIEDA